jgi:hypothetical protein
MVGQVALFSPLSLSFRPSTSMPRGANRRTRWRTPRSRDPKRRALHKHTTNTQHMLRLQHNIAHIVTCCCNCCCHANTAARAVAAHSPRLLLHTSLPRPQATRTAQTHNKHTTHAAFTTQHCTHCHMLLQLLLPCQHCCPRSGRTQPATPAAKHSPPARSLRQLHIILPTVGQAARRLGEVRVCVCACVRVCVCVCVRACACRRRRRRTCHALCRVHRAHRVRPARRCVCVHRF